MQLLSNRLRRYSRTVHRDLSYFLSGMIIIYAVSGLFMNHRDSFNPHYSVTLYEGTLEALPEKQQTDRAAVEAVMKSIGVREKYVKHYFPHENELKVFLKGGSSVAVGLDGGKYRYESLRRRPVLSAMTTLHYNPGRLYTWFADFFAVGLIAITVTGIAMLKGRQGLIGRGGIELLAGILLPVLFMLI